MPRLNRRPRCPAADAHGAAQRPPVVGERGPTWVASSSTRVSREGRSGRKRLRLSLSNFGHSAPCATTRHSLLFAMRNVCGPMRRTRSGLNVRRSDASVHAVSGVRRVLGSPRSRRESTTAMICASSSRKRAVTSMSRRARTKRGAYILRISMATAERLPSLPAMSGPRDRGSRRDEW
jgi:hypothetical protein